VSRKHWIVAQPGVLGIALDQPTLLKHPADALGIC
jgi:hypothetical protein